MAEKRREIIEERRRLKVRYGKLFDDVAALLFRHDPVNINFETNRDEYEPEVGTILPRLRNCVSAEDVCRVTHEEFVRWFGAESAGTEQHYAKIAAEIWEHWQKFNAASSI
jgi:hypothetical protein